MRTTNTTDPKTEIGVELKSNAKMLRRKALAAEAEWRATHGFRQTGPLPMKPITKQEPEPLERKEVERREQRRQQWIERQVLRAPLLNGTSEAGTLTVRVDTSGKWLVCQISDGVIVAGDFTSNAAAWAWIDDHDNAALEIRRDRIANAFRER